MAGPSRRSVLRAGGVAAAGLLLGADGPGAAVVPVPRGDVRALRERWREVTAGRLDGAALRAAARHRDTMAPTSTSLWPGLPFPSFAGTPARLLAMARAYAHTGEEDLAEAVALGIGHYRRHVYRAGADPVGNWWHWQIGVPRRLLDAAVLVGPDRLGEPEAVALAEAVDHFLPERILHRYDGRSTAANRVDHCLVMLLRAMLTGDARKAALAVWALAPVFRHVSEGDGFYRDGSFIQHLWVPYQGTYGATLLRGVATLFAVLRGTPWETADPFVFKQVDRSFAPFVHDGLCMNVVSGRAVGRQPYGDHRRGHAIASAILLLGESAPAATRERWRAMVKGWAARNRTGLYDDLDELLDGVPAAPEPVGHRLFPMSARAVHRRPGWCAALSMASHRIGHYEHGNGENRRGWHTGSGMLLWWGEGHGDQYSFWDALDPYRLPGTTVSTKRLPEGAGGEWGDTRTPWRWVGGATDGVYATVGQHLSGLDSTMEAFKSWVFLDEAVVCLGAGITSRDGVPVETIVDNRKAPGPLAVGPGWAHLEGHAGYVVPEGLRHQHGERVTLWLDHGVDPVSAGYAYLLLPGASLAETRARAAAPSWVIANTGRQQGVHVPSLGLTAVNFWNAGTAGRVSASAPCAVLVRETGDGTATLTVADPRCELEELTVVWDRPVASVVRGHPLLAGASTGRRLTLRFGRLAGQEGASVTVRVRLFS
ncbi:polysaccharide lyase 8 family protein [Thermoactinospora rubra]|uniref:polysaccharide lyase 8 family protein n=1 Tax=Thermoactinospora rubra TaxID=1088767 RepID=UPI000A11A4C9|nr:polysaccharide lyase 8 family protein [Thermoactinospora rubra]